MQLLTISASARAILVGDLHEGQLAVARVGGRVTAVGMAGEVTAGV